LDHLLSKSPSCPNYFKKEEKMGRVFQPIAKIGGKTIFLDSKGHFGIEEGGIFVPNLGYATYISSRKEVLPKFKELTVDYLLREAVNRAR